MKIYESNDGQEKAEEKLNLMKNPPLSRNRSLLKKRQALLLLTSLIWLALNARKLPMAPAQKEEMIALTGAKILTATSQDYERGTIIIQNGKIADLGESQSIKIPEVTKVIDVSGCLITPGLIEAHSHLGLGPSGGVTEDNEMNRPSYPPTASHRFHSS